jgi:hypothetical protein
MMLSFSSARTMITTSNFVAYQCYKFESQTEMALMTATDLQRATAQGTILPIAVDGVMYGHVAAVASSGGGGGGAVTDAAIIGAIVVAALVCLALLMGGLWWMCCSCRRRRRRKNKIQAMDGSLKESLNSDDTSHSDDKGDVEESREVGPPDAAYPPAIVASPSAFVTRPTVSFEDVSNQKERRAEPEDVSLYQFARVKSELDYERKQRETTERRIRELEKRIFKRDVKEKEAEMRLAKERAELERIENAKTDHERMIEHTEWTVAKAAAKRLAAREKFERRKAKIAAAAELELAKKTFVSPDAESIVDAWEKAKAKVAARKRQENEKNVGRKNETVQFSAGR